LQVPLRLLLQVVKSVRTAEVQSENEIRQITGGVKCQKERVLAPMQVKGKLKPRFTFPAKHHSKATIT
jgi:hypothetical protein